MVLPDGLRVGGLVRCGPCFQLWDGSATKIAQLELLQALMALLTFPEHYKEQTGVYYMDNLAAMYALCKGRSESPELDKMAGMVHAVLFSLRCAIYWEWFESRANWADAISRHGHHDEFHRREGFRVHDVSVPLFLWKLPWRAFLNFTEYL